MLLLQPSAGGGRWFAKIPPSEPSSPSRRFLCSPHPLYAGSTHEALTHSPVAIDCPRRVSAAILSPMSLPVVRRVDIDRGRRPPVPSEGPTKAEDGSTPPSPACDHKCRSME